MPDTAETLLGRLAREVAQIEVTLVRIDERQTGWATKQELTQANSAWLLELQPVGAKAEAAHRRLDAINGSLVTLNAHFDGLNDKLDNLLLRTAVREAERHGTWRVLRPALSYVLSIASALSIAYLIGRYTR